jgi:O-antigen/teichoic acid export membrane protein
MRAALRESFPFLLAAVFVKLYSSLDVQFLYRVLGQAAVGVYGVAYKYTYAFQFVPLAFSAALYPRLAALIGQGNKAEAAQLLERAFRYMLVIGLPLTFGLMAVAAPAILLAGEEYSAGIAVLSLMPLALLPSFLDIPVGSVLNAAHRQTFKTMLFGATLVLNAVLNALLIPRFGMMGAAYASIISLTVLFVSGFRVLPRILPTFHLGKVARIAIAPAVAALGMYGVTRATVGLLEAAPPVELAVAVPVGGVTYALLLIAFGGISRAECARALALIRRKPTPEAYEDPAPDA